MVLRAFQLTAAKNAPDGAEVGTSYWFWCPGCDEAHQFRVMTDGSRPSWTFDGNMEKPTFSPSLLYPTKPVKCHLFVRAGVIEFCGDSQHKLAGQKVPLPELPDWLKR